VGRGEEKVLRAKGGRVGGLLRRRISSHEGRNMALIYSTDCELERVSAAA
jgi:hypothetical protein